MVFLCYIKVKPPSISLAEFAFARDFMLTYYSISNAAKSCAGVKVLSFFCLFPPENHMFSWPFCISKAIVWVCMRNFVRFFANYLRIVEAILSWALQYLPGGLLREPTIE